MELGTIIITLVVIIACIVPFALISRSNRNKRQLELQKLSALAAEYDSEIVQHDTWYNAIIGADEGFQRIFFLKKTGETVLKQQIPLSEVKECQIINTNRTLNDANGERKITDKLELVFRFKDKQKADCVLVFYDSNTDSLSLAGELQLANKWAGVASKGIG